MRNIFTFAFKRKSFFFSLVLSIVLVGTLARTYTNAQMGDCYTDIDPLCYGQDRVDAQENQAISQHPINASAFSGLGLEIARQLTGIGNSPNPSMSDVNKSALGFMNTMMVMAYSNPPANLAYWVEDTGQTLGFIPKKTYAQGTGFVGLRPILNIWRVFRNVAYVLLSMSIVVVGFMIMFRRKIDPHTVVTVQNALPRIIIVLITITFSYAIAAFLIELMYVVMFILITIIGGSFGSDIASISNIYVTGGAGDLMGRMFAPLSVGNGGLGTLLGVGGIAGGAIGAAGGPLGSAVGALIGGLFGLILSGVLSLVTTGSFAGLITPILWLVFAVAIFFAFFRIFFLLIGTYIQILVSIITAPIVLLLDVFPGNNGFLNWIMGLVSNLLTFVVVAGVLMITGAIVTNLEGAQLWSPPFIGGIDSDLLKMIIGVGGVMMIPNAVKMMKDALKVQASAGVGSGAAGALSQPISVGTQVLQTAASISHLKSSDLNPFKKKH